MRFTATLLILLLVICIVGCRHAETGPPPGETSPPPGADTTVPKNAERVEVELGEWYVRLSPGTIKAGPVLFIIRNVGNSTHAFEVKGQGTEHRSPILSPGATIEMISELKPGVYEAYCPIDNHSERGMHTTLDVR